MSTESASPDHATDTVATESLENERMNRYRTMAAAFSYPDERFFEHFADFATEADAIRAEYDRLFRAADVWLYGAEYVIDNEFQRARMLADIMGFYNAFGLEPDRDRPDAITCEMEFMHCLILKTTRAGAGLVADDDGEKAAVCRDGQVKFFAEHVAPTATNIANRVIEQSQHEFYTQAAQQLLEFIDEERQHLGCPVDQTPKGETPQETETAE